MSDIKKLLIICGPTATGKTDLAVRLAQRFDGELVSADSRQIYRGMDIGTGKDKDFCTKANIPIQLLDVADPDEEFSVKHYMQLAFAAIADIQHRGKLPIVVGGTGLYIQSVIRPIETAVIPPDPELRKKLSLLSRDELQKMMQKTLPRVWDTLNNSDRNNPRRLIRKLEIQQWNQTHTYTLTKSCICNFLSKDSLMIGVTTSYDSLYKRIDARVDKRVKEGVIGEITQLLNKGYSWDLPSMSALGYREWRSYVENHESKENVIQQWKFDEHAYARRQMTWFRKQKEIHWFDSESPGYEKRVTAIVSKWYTKNEL